MAAMNTPNDSTPPPATSADAEMPATTRVVSPEDDFENETLGERQAEACSLDEGCTVCQ
jgi:hypothetical protein